MGCRIGISTKPQERIDYWKSCEKHTDSEILHCGLSYDAAQLFEDLEAEERGCVSSPGGKPVPGDVWSVYHVWGGVVRQ